MSETRLHAALRAVVDDLKEASATYALIGGLAVSARTEPRFTRDLDLAVAVSNDREAEDLIDFFRRRGYRIVTVVEQEATSRLATVRLIPPGDPGLFADLLFASSGIEQEIVAGAEPIEIIPQLTVPVAKLGHLIATKILSRSANRPQDQADLIALLTAANASDRNISRHALHLIEERGFHRGKDLLAELNAIDPV